MYYHAEYPCNFLLIPRACVKRPLFSRTVPTFAIGARNPAFWGRRDAGSTDQSGGRRASEHPRQCARAEVGEPNRGGKPPSVSDSFMATNAQTVSRSYAKRLEETRGASSRSMSYPISSRRAETRVLMVSPRLNLFIWLLLWSAAYPNNLPYSWSLIAMVSLFMYVH